MPSLPIPMISSLVLGFLLLRMWLAGQKQGPLSALLAMCAIQGLIISLAHHYMVPGMQILQPFTATLIPPMAWVAFQSTAVRRFVLRDMLSFAGLPCVALFMVTLPDLIDILIPGLFLGFGAAILWRSLQGADALPRMRLESGDVPTRIWQVIGGALVASAFSDVLIIAAQLGGVAYLQPWIISLYSSVMLLVIGVLALSGALAVEPSEYVEALPSEISEIDAEITARFDDLLLREKHYLNPDLTLSQLSRKLRIPVKQLSAAVNRVKGQNVSRTINAERIKAAQEALRAGQSVTNAMLMSGFNTKSNFNREFRRVVGQSPSEWAAMQA